MPVPCLAPHGSHQSSGTGKEQGQTQHRMGMSAALLGARLGVSLCRTCMLVCLGIGISLQNVPCREMQASGKRGGNKENQTRPEQLALARSEQR